MENIKSPGSQSEHQKQTLWQVWIPLIAGILIILVLAFLVASTGLNGGEEGGRLAGISLILFTIPTLVFSFFVIVVFALLIFGIYKLTVVLPIYSFKAFTYIVLASEFIRLWADRITQPVIITREGIASLNRFLDIISLKSHK